ncbi:DNA adenine methylase [Candidatus Pacearchaeota archaeon]|nr:DNA adenine methylase [Candidatus Pacearchaeota archaeon]
MVIISSQNNLKPQLIKLKSLYSDQIPKATYLTHGFDRYPSKMIPHMAKFLIEKITKPDQIIIDPFCGSGAVLVEALLNGRHAIGVDLNPLATTMAKCKTTVYDHKILNQQREWLLEEFKKCEEPYQYIYPNANYWFTSATLRKFGTIKHVLDECSSKFEPNYMQFWHALLASIVRSCSRADTRGPKPFISKRAREKRCGIHFDPFKFFNSTSCKWISVEHELHDILLKKNNTPKIKVLEGDTRNLCSLLPNQKVDAIITSPPYVNAQDYYRASKLELFTLGMISPDNLRKLSRQFVGSDRIRSEQSLLCNELPSSLAEGIKSKLIINNKKSACVFSKYVLDMSDSFEQFHTILKDRGYCAIVSGTNFISGIDIPTHDILAELAHNRGFELTYSFMDAIRDRWVPTVRNGHNGVIRHEYLMVFKKSR